jgi:arylsulfatase A-like enzyme
VSAGLQSLILITVDCLRADHAGFLGYKRPTTPFLDSLAHESIVFENAIIAGSPTYYSLPAVLASRYSLALGRDLVGIAPQEDTIASVLSKAGFETAAFIASNPYLSSRFGYDQGFDLFQDFLGTDPLLEQARDGLSRITKPNRTNQLLRKLFYKSEPGAAFYDEVYFRYCQRFGSAKGQSLDALRKFPSADVIVDHAITWLKRPAEKPFFLWLHLMDPHAPYYPKQEALVQMGNDTISARRAGYLNSYWARTDLGIGRLQKKRDEVIALYDAGVRWVDTQVRRLAEALVDLNLWNQCTLAVTADHGEEFLEHGGRFHAPLKLTEELIRVPLMVRAPMLNPTIVAQPFSLIDLSPSLLEGLRIPAPGSFRGHSCWNQILRGETWNRPVLTECVHGCTNPFRRKDRLGPRILAVRSGRFKLVVNFCSSVEHLFDLQHDSGEHSPLPLDAQKTARRELLEIARQHLAESRQSRDFNQRFDTKLRDLRLEWAHSPTTTTN